MRKRMRSSSGRGAFRASSLHPRCTATAQRDGIDEEKTLAALEAQRRELIDPLIDQHPEAEKFDG